MAWSKNLDWSVYFRIPDELQERYLAKLGMDVETPSKDYLDRLVKAHQCNIPFENLSVTLWNEPVCIEPGRLMDKLLNQKRGGYCFELNGLFHLLLRTMGFDAWMLPCRQLRHSERCPVPATHCAIGVTLDGRNLFCDVGYGGPMPHGSIEWETGTIQTVDNQSFYFEEDSTGWFSLVKKSSCKDIPLLQAAKLRFNLCDFYGQNLLRSTGNSAYSTLHVSRLTPDGYLDLTDDKLVIAHGATREEKIISNVELETILRDYFEIEKAKVLKDMTLEELWKLFPVVLTPHNPQWPIWAVEEMEVLKALLAEFNPVINHIGSTAVQGIWAKPIVDILVEMPEEYDPEKAAEIMERAGYIRMAKTPTRMSFNKGYTPEGYAEKVFHIHFHLFGDNDELLFRDYLNLHRKAAEEYERLKRSLLPRYKHDRDGYTEAKTDFVRSIVSMATH